MFFKIGDFVTPVIIGGITAFAVLLSVSPGGSMLWAMIAGMLWGMAAQVVVYLLLMPLFGAFEVMVPAMLTGMIGGMLTGMLASSGLAGGVTITVCGMLVGVAVYRWILRRNRALQGRVQWYHL